MRGRRYLSGLDWIIHALDHATRRVSGSGNASQLVLELNRPIDPELLQARLSEFAGCFPQLAGRVARAWTLEPYWKMRGAASLPVAVYHVRADGVDAVLQKAVNEPLHTGRYVAFHLLLVEGGACRLAMTFDHRLLDARGAELFLKLFFEFCDGLIDLQQIAARLPRSVPSYLPGWRQKFESGRQLMRRMRAFSSRPIVRLAPSGGQPGAGCFSQWSLDLEQSEAFIKRAYAEAGFLLFMPYALSMALAAFHAVCERRGVSGQYVVPCTTDLRGSNLSLETLFFNYSSMFFFQAEGNEIARRSPLVDSIKRQFYEQTKGGLPTHMSHVMALMRILPVSLFDWMICQQMPHCFGSFSFASVGGSSLEKSRVLGAEIENLYHMPLIPPQVGVGFFFNQFRGRVNMGVSFREGLLDAEELRIIESVYRTFI
jgi:hypothetical protein